MVNEEVDAEEIAEVVSRWTGIPVSRMLQSEKQKLLNIETELHMRVVGQEEAISAVADAIRTKPRGFAGSQTANRIFYLLGHYGGWKNRVSKGFG